MSFADLLSPRPEVLSDRGIEGIIDLANLQDRRHRKIEAKPQQFLDLTYPTADVQRLVTNLHRRFRGDEGIPGLFLMEGLKGSGKSHMLLLAYHLLKSPDVARSWLAGHGLECALPQDVIVVVNKFTDLPLLSIWDFVFEQVTGRHPPVSAVQPGLEEVERVLAGRRVTLILDELEQGIQVISDPAIKRQNIAFLQMLSEWANRSGQVTLLASIYSDRDEPGSTLKRVPHLRIQFAHASDQARIVLHRLFVGYPAFDRDRAAPVVDSYLNLWARHLPPPGDDYRSRLLEAYPFLPELLDLMLQRVPARGGFQNLRGALGFLGNMVRLSHQQADIITAAHAPLSDRVVAALLGDLDTTGDLVSKARTNASEIAGMDMPLASGIASTTMLYTLTSSGRMLGATRDELLKHVLRPGVDINDFERTLMAFQKYAAHFWPREGRFYFDLEENPEAKVEYASLRVDADDPSNAKARDHLRGLWLSDVFRETTNSTVFSDVEGAKEALESLDSNRLRYVLAPRRLSAEERHALFYGVANRNQVILLEPRDAAFDLDHNRDLIKWAQREIAAGKLSRTTDDPQRRADYERIGRGDRRNCTEAIRRAGMIFVHWEHYGELPARDRIEEEGLPGDGSKDKVLEALSQHHFPVQLVEEHLRDRIEEIKGRTVREVDQEYRQTLGFPVPTMAATVSNALGGLCRQGHLGIRHPRGNFCRETPSLTSAEIMVATIDEPFEAPAPVPVAGGTPQAGTRNGAGGRSGSGAGGIDTGTASGTTAAVQGRTETLAVPPQPGAGTLRQAMAARLQSFDDPVISRVQFTVHLNEEAGDLSTLPAAIRGSMAGAGSINVEIAIQKTGSFSKADVEQMAESLPSLTGANYSVRLEVAIPSTAQPAEDADA